MNYLKDKDLICTLNSIHYEDLKEEIKQRLEETRKEKVIPNAYKPTKLTLKKLETNHLGKVSIIAAFSPCRVEVLTNKNIFSTLIKQHFGISKDKIKRLEESTKELLISSGLKGLRKVFYENREKLLPYQELFSNDYDEKLFKHLVKYRESPIKREEKLYKQIEDIFINIVKIALKIYFKINDEETSQYSMSIDCYTDMFLVRYRMHCLTLLDNMNPYYINEIQKKIYENPDSWINDEFRELYPKFKIKPLTYSLLNKDKNRGVIGLRSGDCWNVERLVEIFEEVSGLMSKKEVEVFLNAINCLIKEYREKNEKESDEYFRVYSNRMLRTINKIPTIIRELENNKV
ncbi:hypothetical protein U8V72_20375 [Priestia filamentosa]|uniref:hypothetical protein n=1 Tax=Priestia filamentosa TaxID=1402861 RepID=UPI00058913E5